MNIPAINGGPSVRNSFLPAFEPYITEDEIQEVTDTLTTGWITRGPKTKKFEDQFTDYLGVKNAIALNSCTSALHLSLVAFNIGNSAEVITTPFTFVSTVEVIVHQGATPVLVDIDEETYNIDSKLIEDKITDRTRAIIPVHYGGHPCEMDEIEKIAREYDLVIIEDAAHALGATYRGRKIGTIGDTTCFSFYSTKNLTTGEGGMITIEDDDIANKCRSLSMHGFDRNAWQRYSSKGSWYYEIRYPGFKYNMTDIQASLGIRQLHKFEDMQEKRKSIAKLYQEGLKDTPSITLPTIRDYVNHAWHLFPILIDFSYLSINRSKFIEALKAENVGSSVHFIPIHYHPFYNEFLRTKKGDFPITEFVYEREVSLPIYPSMTNKDVLDVIQAIKKIIDFFALK